MPDHEPGLYYSSSPESFKSAKQIQYENIDDPVLIREKVGNREPSFYEWIDEFSRRRDLKSEVEGLPEEIDVHIETNKPIIIGLLGDPHGGGYEVDYELLAHDVAFISQHPQAYAVLGGDLIEGFFFNPAQDEQIASFNQQRKFNNSMIKEIGLNKILFFEAGDHDMWSGKMGMTIYDEIRDTTGIPIVRGSTKTNLYLPEVKYRMVSAHRLPGHSIYNDTHPEMRESKFGTQGADIYVGWHTHKKGISKQVVDTVDGCLEQIYISSGPYKYSDEYARKKGWAKQGAKKRGAVFLVLHPFEKRLNAYYSAEEALEVL